MAATTPSPPDAPVDPRHAWVLPDPGRLPVVEDLDEMTVRVVAPNPSPMTLDGTNTYLIGPPGSHEAVVVDPGPADADHLRRVREVLDRRRATPVAIMVTHHHADHAAAASAWAEAFGCVIAASSPAVAGEHGRRLADGDLLTVAGARLAVIATPGHTRDHLSLRLPNGAVLTGDHVLGRGTSVVAHPDGDLAAYLESLRRLLELGPDALYPGHGPALLDDPTAVLAYYRDHRAYREAQILEILDDGPASPAELVARIYAAVDRAVWPAAEASTRAALEVLRRRGRIVLDRDERARSI